MRKHIVFDIGNVLLRFEPLKWLQSIYSDEQANFLYRAVFCGPEWTLLDQGIITDGIAVERMIARHPEESSEIKNVFSNWDKCMTPIAGMEVLVTKCLNSKFSVFALSNFSLRCRSVLHRYPAYQNINNILVSSEERLVKPDYRIYQRFCSKFNVLPSDCLFFDDYLPNVSAAIASGFNAYQFVSASETENIIFHLLS